MTTPTGRIGRRVLDAVLDGPEPVRVIARDPAALRPGVLERVEVVQGRHDDPAVLARAFAGARTVFWVVPPDLRAASVVGYYTGFTRPACEAITREGVERVVAVSSLGRGVAEDVGLVAGAYAMDDLLEATGVRYRALRMPAFMDNVLAQADLIRTQGTFVGSQSADGRGPACATRDVAAAAAALLLDGTWTGQGSAPVLGPEDLSFADMAEIASQVLRRPVRYEQLSGEDHVAALVEQGMSAAYARGVVENQEQADRGAYTAEPRTPANTSPTTFRQFCLEELGPAVLAGRAREVREGFAHLHAVDPVLAALIDARPDYDADAWRRELPEMDLFGCLVFQVIGQQISVTAAGAILGRLSRGSAGRIPSPAEVAAMDEQALRDVGLSWRKARTLRDLAARFADGRLSEERLSALSDDAVVAELTQIHGVGPWTVHGALLIALRRADVVATGDIMLANTMKECYGLDHVPDEREISDIAAAWTPHGSLGVNLLFAAAEAGGGR